MRHRMTDPGMENGYGSQVGMEYPLTPYPVPDFDAGGEPEAMTPGTTPSAGLAGRCPHRTEPTPAPWRPN